MSIIGESLIYGNKVEAIESLYSVNLNNCFDGQEIIARYYKDNGDIASVIGLVHKTNGVENIEIKDGEGSENTGGTGKQFVVKKKFPLYPVSYLNYYYQGNGAKFQVPKLRSGDVMQIIFPREFIPAGHGDPDFDSNTNFGRAYYFLQFCQRVKLGSFSTLKWEMENNRILVHSRRTNNATIITIEYNRYFPEDVSLPMFHLPMLFDRNMGFAVCSTGDANQYTMLFDQATLESYGDWREIIKTDANTFTSENAYERQTYSSPDYWDMEDHDNPVRLIVVDYRRKMRVIDGTLGLRGRLNAETTSPGFRIENGIIKCYKTSSLKYVFNRFDGDFYAGQALYWPLSDRYNNYKTKELLDQNYVSRFLVSKMKKDNTILYYHVRNIHGGITPHLVANTNAFLNGVVGSQRLYTPKGHMHKEEGRVEYLGTTKHALIENTIERLTLSYEGINHDNGRWVFILNKSETQFNFLLEKIGVEFRGTDGFLKTGYMEVVSVGGVEGNTVDSGESYDVMVECENLYVKENNRYVLFGNSSIDYSASITFKYATIDFIVRQGQYFPEGKNIPASPIRIMRRKYSTKTKWKILNRRKSMQHGDWRGGVWWLPSRFMKNYFNTCKYYRKYKGVKSEFPETFYTR